MFRDVSEDLAELTGYDLETCETMVKTGGYTIYATIDPTVQAAVDAVYEDLANVPTTTSAQQLQSAIVVVDNESGDIVGMAGGVGRRGLPDPEPGHPKHALPRLLHQTADRLRPRDGRRDNHPVLRL